MKLRQLKQRLGFVKFYSFVLLMLSLAFYAGHEFANKRHYILANQVKMLLGSIDNLKEENQVLNSQLNIKKVELEVASIANEKDMMTIKQGLDKESELRRQISFYQKVMAPELTQDGFVIESLEIIPTASKRNFAIKMMMLQHEDIKAVVKGVLTVNLHGSLDGKPKRYHLSELQDEPKSALAFSFKYFQVLETRITLPENFSPERFEIFTEIFKYKRKRGDYQTEIYWGNALNNED